MRAIPIFITIYLVATFLPLNIFAESKLYMVIVGVADYPGDESDLNLTVKDATTISALYKANAKKTNGNCKTVLLTDKQATVNSIILNMQNLYSYANKEDIIALFFSGHGCEEGFCANDKILSFDKIKQCMSLFKCNSKMIFADACFSGMIRENRNEKKFNIENIRKSFLLQGESIMLFMSSRSNEYSYENYSMNNGFFTNALQFGLRGKADINKDRIITASELFKYVSKNVAKKSNGKQHPVMWGNFSNDMPIIMW